MIRVYNEYVNEIVNLWNLFYIEGYDMLEVGTKAPDFTLPDQNGDMHSLEDYRGKKVLLYFYPKDNTCLLYTS